MRSQRRLVGVTTRRPLLKFRVIHVVLVAFCLSVCLLLVISASFWKQTTAFPKTQVTNEKRLSLRPWVEHLQHRKGVQYTLSFRRPNGKWKNPIKSFSSITADDLGDLDLPIHHVKPSETDISQKNFVLDLLAAAGVTEIDYRVIDALPTWEKFVSLYGPSESPIVLGVEACEKLRKFKEEKELYLGVAGMFNTGTTTLDLYRKCQSKQTKTSWGALFLTPFVDNSSRKS